MDISCLTQDHPGFKSSVLQMAYQNVGIRRGDAFKLARQCEFWFRSSGILWTVDHLKKVKQLYVNRMAVGGVNPDWIARKGGLPDNAFSLLAAYPVHVLVKAINVYKVFRLPPKVVTAAQASKHLNAVRRGPVDQTGLKVAKFLIRKASRHWEEQYRDKGSIPYLACVQTLNSDEEKLVDREYTKAFTTLMNTDAYKRFPSLRKVTYPVDVLDYIESFKRNASASKIGFITRRCKLDVRPVGTVYYAQEPGLKCRMFASPDLLFQAGLEPLKRGLADLLLEIKEDCTFDHVQGLMAAQEALNAGKVVHSIDLSSATDSFPFELQLDWLRRTDVSRELVELLEYVSTGIWNVSPGLKKAGFPETLSWTVGQPLGTGPSFFLFALTHHFLVRGLFIALQRPYAYAILGDDILIWDDAVAQAYIEVMNSLGCKVSKEKTISSAHIAEFASVLVTKTMFLVSTKHQAITQDSFMEYLLTFGQSAKDSFVGNIPRRKKVIEALANIPETLGGLGWNPDHLTLDARLETESFANYLRWKFADRELQPVKSRVTLCREVLSRVGLLGHADQAFVSIAPVSQFSESQSQLTERLSSLAPPETEVFEDLLLPASRRPWKGNSSSFFDNQGKYIGQKSSRKLLDESRTWTEVTPKRSLFTRMARALGSFLGT